MKRTRGFTLLECLVALAILAVALGAAMRAVGASTQSAALLRDHGLASWVAQNHLAELRARQLWPPLGINQGEAEQAGQRFIWRENVQPTPNPLFLRVDVAVHHPDDGRPLASLTGFLARPLQ